MSKDDLLIQPDNGQMKMWASRGYIQMLLDSDFYDGEITYNVHPFAIMKEINDIKPGNLVSTARRRDRSCCGVDIKRYARL